MVFSIFTELYNHPMISSNILFSSHQKETPWPLVVSPTPLLHLPQPRESSLFPSCRHLPYSGHVTQMESLSTWSSGNGLSHWAPCSRVSLTAARTSTALPCCQCPAVWIHQIYSPGHLPGCFHSLGGMENAAMNTGVQFWCGRVFISQGCTQEWNCWVIWQLYV